MQYYKVKPHADNKRKSVKSTDILVRNELYTAKELQKFTSINSLFVQDNFIEVEVSKKDTYFMFGARFCKQQSYNN